VVSWCIYGKRERQKRCTPGTQQALVLPKLLLLRLLLLLLLLPPPPPLLLLLLLLLRFGTSARQLPATAGVESNI
jgi:hypothetical protein